jgi:hypothetical protein
MKMAIKSFKPPPAGKSKSIERDIRCGIDPRLMSEYTIVYQEVFEMQGSLSVSMPLMKITLETYLQSKKFLNDEVVNILC